MSMKNTKIIATAIIIPLLSITSIVSADFDCTSVDRETTKTIMDKQKSWETLTSSEQELVENMKECKPQRWQGDMWNREWWKWEKKWEKVNSNKVEKIKNVAKTKRVVKNLSTSMKTKITKVVAKVSTAFNNLSDEEKVERFETLQDKLEDKLEIILDNDNLSDSKKEALEDIVNEILNQIDDKIEVLN